ncbi:MAG: protein tyrosine phosphatase [Bauldia sp.]|nr:protein tyrosine phosphatase [Bauldia sp.]MCW5719205.1 protein tyrosine phosphatase [Bauldia sp.]
MPSVHVCSLPLLEPTATASGASHLVTIVDVGTPVRRPAVIPPDRHLFLGFHDMTIGGPGVLLPAEHHIRTLLEFVQDDWDRERPLLVHCYAGVSRSTAAAFITVCASRPDRDEAEIAAFLRKSSPTAFPNPLMVAIADRMLGREGRMSAAIAGIGPGVEGIESTPFALPLRP